MSLTSRVVAVKGVRAGETVGYGARFVAERPTTLAVVPAGYADGLDRRLEGRGSVLIRGRRAPIVGAVSMDMLTVDVTDIGDVGPGDEVVFLGSQGTESWQTIDAREMAAGSARFPTRSSAASAPGSNDSIETARYRERELVTVTVIRSGDLDDATMDPSVAQATDRRRPATMRQYRPSS